MAVTLDTIVKSGLLVAFIIPIFAYMAITLPAPTPIATGVTSSSSYNITAQYNNTATYIRTKFVGSTAAISHLALNTSGGFYASAIEYEAFAFIFDGFGQMMQDIVQIPILDVMAMNMFMLGLDSIFPTVVSGALVAGIALMQAYLMFSMVMLGLSMIMKYNART